MTESHAIRIARGSAYLMAQKVATTAISVVALGLIARMLTQTEMGVVVVLTLALGIAQLLSDFGFSSGLTKHIAEYRGKKMSYSPFLTAGSLVNASIAGFIAVMCAVTSEQLSQILLGSTEYSFLFQLLGLALFFFCVNTAVNSFLLGLNKVREMAVLNLVNVFIRQVSGITFLMMGFGLVGLVFGWVLGDSVYFVLSFLLMLKGGHFRRHSIVETVPYLKLLLRFSLPLFLVNIIVFLYTWFDRVILLNYMPLNEVAVYDIALRAFGVLYIVPTIVSNVLFPYYSEQFGKNEHENIAVAINATTRYIALLYTPLALGLMITANPVISLFAGMGYARGDVVLGVLSFLGGIGGIGVALGVLLLVYNMTVTVLLVNLASIGVSLAMAPLLLPFFGTTGMAFIKGCTMVITFVLTVVVLRKHVSVEFDKEAMWKGWIAAFIMMLVVWLVEHLFFSRYLVPLYVIVGGVVYVLALRIMKVVNEKDIQLLRDFMGERMAPLVDFLAKIVR